MVSLLNLNASIGLIPVLLYFFDYSVERVYIAILIIENMYIAAIGPIQIILVSIIIPVGIFLIGFVKVGKIWVTT